jgi:hypothetical protein
MKKLMIVGVAVALGIGLLGVAGYRALRQYVEPAATRQAAVSSEAATAPAPGAPPPPAETRPAGDADRGFIYGRVTTVDGATYQGRLRFGQDQEAFWGDYFNGVKHENPWIAQVAAEQIPKRTETIEVFGWKLGEHTAQLDVTRQLTARFGEVSKIEAEGQEVRVTLKSGSVVDVNRFDASDFDDGVRVWDARGVTDLDSGRIRSIELLPTMAVADPPARLYGTVRSRQGDFTGFIEWDREECVGTDELDGRDPQGVEHHVRFDTIRSIEGRSRGSSQVTLTDGSELTLSGTNDVNGDNRGIVVDDPRYGRVVVSWWSFERADFTPKGSGPGYGDYAPGTKISGTVATRDGRKLSGKIVYDLDESETTETLDGSFEGVDYTLPFGTIASVEPSIDHPTRVKLKNGQELRLEWDGDVGEQNAGMLVFVEGQGKPTYVPWADVVRIELDKS